MKKPEALNTTSNGESKKGIKEFWANKSTRWTVIVFLVVLVVTIGQFVLKAVIG